jgi:hypothetical protein
VFLDPDLHWIRICIGSAFDGSRIRIVNANPDPDEGKLSPGRKKMMAEDLKNVPVY